MEVLSRRDFIRRAVVGISAATLVTNRSEGNVLAQNESEPDFSEETLSNIDEVTVSQNYLDSEPLTGRKIGLEVNSDPSIDSPTDLKTAHLNFANVLYRYQNKYTTPEYASKLAEGVVPSENISSRFIQKVESDEDLSVPINALFPDGSYAGEFNVNSGLEFGLLSNPGQYRLNSINLGDQHTGFSPIVGPETGKLSLGVYLSEYYKETLGVNDNSIKSHYAFILTEALEFLMLTGGNQEIWDAYCVNQDQPVALSRSAMGNKLFHSVAEPILGNYQEGDGWPGPLRIIASFK